VSDIGIIALLEAASAEIAASHMRNDREHSARVDNCIALANLVDVVERIGGYLKGGDQQVLADCKRRLVAEGVRSSSVKPDWIDR